MKTYSKTIAASILAVLALNAQAVTYNDATSDIAFGPATLDITSVEVTHNATDLFFTISVNAASITSPDWGKYTVGFDTAAGGDTSSPVGNPWGRNISMSSGMDYWVGSWVDGGGGRQLWSYTGSWNLLGASSVGISGGSVNFSVPLAALGLSPGSTFNFDVYSTGGDGGNPAVDALGNPNQTVADWGGAYNSGANVLSYTIPAVPEPTALALLGIGASLIIGRIRRR